MLRVEEKMLLCCTVPALFIPLVQRPHRLPQLPPAHDRGMPVAVRSLFLHETNIEAFQGIYRRFVAADGLFALLLPLVLPPFSRHSQAPSTAANSNAPTAQLTSTPTGQGRVYRPRPNLTAIIVSKLSICCAPSSSSAAVAGQREP